MPQSRCNRHDGFLLFAISFIILGAIPNGALAQFQDQVSSESLKPNIARFLDSFVLVHTPHGYVLGRRRNAGFTPEEMVAQLAKREQRLRRLLPGAEKNFQLRVRKTPMAERNFQLRVRKSGVDDRARKLFLAKKKQLRDRKPFYSNAAESNFQLRVRKTPMAERNFQLRVRKSDPNQDWEQMRVRKGMTSAESNFQLRVRKDYPSMAERNFQLRVRKDYPSMAERNFQLRVRKDYPSMAERNFQLRVRKDYPSMAERNFQLRVRKSDDEKLEDLDDEKVKEMLERIAIMDNPEDVEEEKQELEQEMA